MRASWILTRLCVAFCGAAILGQVGLTRTHAAALDRSSLPISPPPPIGKLAPDESESTIYRPQEVTAPDGAPHILLVMTDDVGFGAASTFGGPIPTPNLDRLAAQGLKYNQFHTAGVCSPTRAALLTGRNHHAVGSGVVVEMASPYPGYIAQIPRSAATVARVLRDNGYNTAMFGKDHNVPAAHISPAGPFDQWPTGRGFDHFYGFLGGDTDQWRSALFDGTTPVITGDEPQRLLDARLVDHAIHWVHSQQAAAPQKPFFIYYAPGTLHAPQQALPEWIARFKGRFDHGWDRQRELTLQRQHEMGVVPRDAVLAARPAAIPAWDSLSAEQQKIAARYMEVQAATLSYQDAQFGRLLDELERMGIADNTLIIFIQGDNGPSADGGVEGTLNEIVHMSAPPDQSRPDQQWLLKNLDLMGSKDSYQVPPAGWAMAMATPFPWTKQIASHLGGVRNGLIISWPAGISRQGEVRSQYHHVIDVMPTVLDAAGIEPPVTVDGFEQQRIDGVSMNYSFAAADGASKRSTQYYEVVGNRAIYHDGWQANTSPRYMPWELSQERADSDPATYDWELYNLSEDFSQARDLAAERPDKLRELQQLFDEQARRNQVYPLQSSDPRSRGRAMRAGQGAPRQSYVYWGPDLRMPMRASPPIFWQPFSIDAELEIPDGGASGVVVAAGSIFGGWSFYLQDGVPVAYAAASQLPGMQARIAARERLPSGLVKLRYEVDFLAGSVAELRILANDRQIGAGRIEQRPSVLAGLGETFDTGRDTNVPVSEDYQNDGVFTGTIRRVEVQLRSLATAQKIE